MIEVSKGKLASQTDAEYMEYNSPASFGHAVVGMHIISPAFPHQHVQKWVVLCNMHSRFRVRIRVR